VDDIYALLHRLFLAAALSAECAIIALVYVKRLIAYTRLALHASNWKRIVLGAVLMASKVWDDQAGVRASPMVVLVANFLKERVLYLFFTFLCQSGMSISARFCPGSKLMTCAFFWHRTSLLFPLTAFIVLGTTLNARF
jgi:hypothetical protein